MSMDELRGVVRARMDELEVRRDDFVFWDVTRSTLERFLAGRRVRPEQVRAIARGVGVQLGEGPVEHYEVEHVVEPAAYDEERARRLQSVLARWQSGASKALR